VTVKSAHLFFVRLQIWLVIAYSIAVFLPITYPWVVLGVGLGAWVLVAILGMILKGRGELPEVEAKLPMFDAPFTVPLIVFSVSVFISGLLQVDWIEAVRSVYTLRAIVVYFWTYQLIRNNPGLRAKVLTGLFSMGTVAGAWGMVEQLLHIHPFTTYNYLQATGFTLHPMAYAGQMQIVAMVAGAFLVSGAYKDLVKPLDKLPVFALVTAFNFLGVLFASERNAWAGVAAAVIVTAAFVSVRMLGSVIIVLAICVMLAWNYVPVVQTRLVQVIENPLSDIGVRVRLEVWKNTIELWKTRPLFGYGVRNFPSQNFDIAEVPGQGDLKHAHSNYLHILATLGISGFLAYTFLSMVALSHSLRNWFYGRDHRKNLDAAIALGVFGSLISLMVAGLFEFNFGTGNVRLMQWFVMGLMVSYVELRPGSGLETPGSDETHDHHG
jgi:O-antigen ligase